MRAAPRRTKLNFMCRMTFAAAAVPGASVVSGEDGARLPLLDGTRLRRISLLGPPTHPAGSAELGTRAPRFGVARTDGAARSGSTRQFTLATVFPK